MKSGCLNQSIWCRHFFTIRAEEEEFIPTIVALKEQWRGIVGTLDTPKALEKFIQSISEEPSDFLDEAYEGATKEVDGSVFSTCLIGSIASIEAAKIPLGIGPKDNNLLYFDLFSMEFRKIKDDELSIYVNKLPGAGFDNHFPVSTVGKELSRYKVLVVGTGGLGSPAAYALTMAGIGTLGLVDYDNVEISNLNRQILHSASRIGMPKVKSAEKFLNEINPGTRLITYNTLLNKKNAAEIIKDYDLVVSGVDNLSARYILNDICYEGKKPMVEAGVLRFDGLSMTIIPGEGACYRCIFEENSSNNNTQSCAEAGVLGPVPGVMGFVQAAEAVKVLTGQGNILRDKLIYYDALEQDFLMFNTSRNSKCSLCGIHSISIM